MSRGLCCSCVGIVAICDSELKTYKAEHCCCNPVGSDCVHRFTL